MNKKQNNVQQELERFKADCRLLKLKLLETDYQQYIDEANGAPPIGFFEFLRNAIHKEADNRREEQAGYRTVRSCLPKPLKTLGDFDFDFQPNLNKKLIMELASLRFMERHESILMTSNNNGVGKSHIARAIALLACQQGYTTLYTSCAELISDLNLGVYEKTLDKRIRKYINPQLLLLDEVGHDMLQLEIVKESHLLFKVINRRYNDNKSMIFTTNLAESDWADFLGDPLTTKAILDRIYHHSVIVKIEGPSYRRHESDKLQKEYTDQQPPASDNK